MRRYLPLAAAALGLLIILLGVALLTRDQPTEASIATPAANDGVARISVQELQSRLQSPNPPQVWDVRGVEAYTEQHIPGAVQVDLGNVQGAAAGVDPNQPVVTLCA